MNIWLVILLAGITTYAIRLSFILLFGWIEMPVLLRRALRFVPPAVLTAIIFPELLMPDGSLDLSAGNPQLLAGLLAVVIAWRTRNAMVTVAAGMVALYLAQALLE